MAKKAAMAKYASVTLQRQQNNDGDCAVYCTDRHASVNLVYHKPAWTTTTKRREENRFEWYTVVNLSGSN